MSKQAVIAGATGLIGRNLLEEILRHDSYDKIYVLARKPFEHPDKRIEVLQVDYNQLDAYAGRLSAHHYYCCLGSASWSAKSREGLDRVDYTYSLAFAQLAEHDQKCTQFLVVTSIGASPTSPIPYNQVKGRLERSVRHLRLGGVQIFRPSLLIGKRVKTRLWEEISKVFSTVIGFLMVGTNNNLLSIAVSDVVQAMYLVAQQESQGAHVYAPSAIRRLSSSKS